jgi:Mrp family chromosome partitioning ATPase
MVDLTSEMAELWASLGPPRAGPGRVIQFASAANGEGTSTVAREFARFAAARTRGAVWLIDLDFADSPQFRTIAADPRRYGALGKASAASPDGSCFFTLQPSARDADGRPVADSRYIVAHPVGGSQLWVTRFRRDLLRPGQGVRIRPAADYWNALRRHTELVVVDSPAAQRSQVGLAVASYMDFTVLVVAADGAEASAHAALKDSILAAGGRCAGLVFNRAKPQPSFLRSFER